MQILSRNTSQCVFLVFFLSLITASFSSAQIVIRDSIDIKPKTNAHVLSDNSNDRSYPAVTFNITLSCQTQNENLVRILENDPCTQEINLDVHVSPSGTYTYKFPAPPTSIGIGFFYYGWQDNGDLPVTYSIDGVLNYTGESIHAEGAVNPRQP